MNKKFILTFAFALLLAPSIKAEEKDKPVETEENATLVEKDVSPKAPQSQKEESKKDEISEDTNSGTTEKVVAASFLAGFLSKCKSTGSFCVKTIDPRSYLSFFKSLMSPSTFNLCDHAEAVTGTVVVSTAAVAAGIYYYQEEIKAKFNQVKEYFTTQKEEVTA